jgi:hypothetical protein
LREPNRKIDMVGRSVGIVFALSVVLFLLPFSAEGQTSSSACAMLAADATTPIVTESPKELRRLLKLCNGEREACEVTRQYVKEENAAIRGLTCDPNTDADPVFERLGPPPQPKSFAPSPSTACALLVADFTTPISDGHEKEWTRLCSLADVRDCQSAGEYVQSEVHKSIPGLTCHGPK